MKIFLLFILLIVAHPVAAQEYYRSNEIGLPLEAVNPVLKGYHEYYLEIKNDQHLRVSTLYREGEEYKKWVLLGGNGEQYREEYYIKGVLVTISYLSGSLLYREENFSETGDLEAITEILYDGTTPKEILYKNGKGELIYRDLFSRNSDGRLREVRRTFSDDRIINASFRYSGGALIEQWYGFGEGGVLYRYFDSILYREEVWGESGIAEETDYFFEGKILIKAKTTYISSKGSLESWYNEEGHIVKSERVYPDDRREITEYSYYEGILSRKTKRAPGILEVWNYYRDDSGTRDIEEYWRNGRLEKKIFYTDPVNYTEEYYIRDKAFLRIYFEEGRKVREESLDISGPRS